jgi:hypothetical protein
VQIAAAHPGRLDADDGVVRCLQLRLGTLLDADLVRSLEGDRLHVRDPTEDVPDAARQGTACVYRTSRSKDRDRR